MSITRSREVRCVCGQQAIITVVESLNAARHPHLRQEVLDRRLHVFSCKRCSRELVVDEALFYFDFARRQLIGVYPPGDLVRQRERAEEVMQVYRSHVCEDAPAMVRSMADEFLVRVCFGYEELREKLVIDEAGLSDLVIEALKCELLARDPAFASNRVATLRVDTVTTEQLEMLCEWIGGLEAAPAEAPRAVTVERSMYDAIAARYDEILDHHPGIASGPHVSALRLGAPVIGR